MADAWGGAWGEGWGESWGAAPAVPATLLITSTEQLTLPINAQLVNERNRMTGFRSATAAERKILGL
jgi:hypothetical protein